ncbi:MAG: PKD domain-containing protein [Cytophagales bacterium]|nr:PKD domain-containing protein [Cytophagales bacterium]
MKFWGVFFLSFISLLFALEGLGQTASDTVCLDESVSFLPQGDPEELDYEWDFCTNDLDQVPAFSDAVQIAANGNTHLSVVHDGENYYGFATTFLGSFITKISFGNSLDNPAAFNSLGNPGNKLNSPYSIQVIQDQGTWYAAVVNFSNSELNLFSFGPSLSSNTLEFVKKVPTGTSINGPRGLKWVHSTEGWFAFVANLNTSELTRLYFGNSVLNDPVVSTINIGAGAALGVEVTQANGLWHAFVAANTIYHVSLGASLNSTTTSTAPLTLNAVIESPANMSALYNKGAYHLLVSSRKGKVFQINLGDEVNDRNGTVVDYGNFAVMNDIIAFQTLKIGTTIRSFLFDFGNNRLRRLSYDQPCSASQATSSSQQPAVSFSAAGHYQIDLHLQSPSAQPQDTTFSLLVRPESAPIVSLSSSSNCQGQVDLSISSNLELANTRWSIADSLLQGTEISHFFTSPGLYEVKVEALGTNGCSNILTKELPIYPPPLASFCFTPGPLCERNPVNFTNLTSGPPDSVTAYRWTFSGVDSALVKNPTYSFLLPGAQLVKLEASIPGCADDTAVAIDIIDAPNTAFTAQEVCLGEITSFSNLSTGDGLSAYLWDFGDGYTITQGNPVHRYEQAGKYPVVLSTSNALGCSALYTDTVAVHALPQALFSYDLACAERPVQLSNLSQVQGSSLAAHRWYLAEEGAQGTDLFSTALDPVLELPQGRYTLSLATTTLHGCRDSTSQGLEVYESPVANFEVDLRCLGHPSTLVDQSHSQQLPISIWTWSVGDSLLYEQHPSLAFDQAGTQSISLTVRNQRLCSDTRSKTIQIPDKARADFDFFQPCLGQFTRFVPHSSQADDPLTKFRWDFDGRGTSFDPEGIFSFPFVDRYEVRLMAESQRGCADTVVKTLDIFSPPQSPVYRHTLVRQGSGQNSIYQPDRW